MPIHTTDEYEAMVGADAADPIIARWAAPVEKAIAKHLRYDPLRAEKTEYYDASPKVSPAYAGARQWDVSAGSAVMVTERDGGRSSNSLQLRRIPLRGTPTIWENDNGYGISANFTNDHLLVYGTDFYMNIVEDDGADDAFTPSGIIFRRNGNWPVTKGSIKVTYEAGYGEDELDGSEGTTGIDASNIGAAAELLMIKVYNTVVGNQKNATTGVKPGTFLMERQGDWMYQTDAITARNISGMLNELPAEVQEKLQTDVHYGLL